MTGTLVPLPHPRTELEASAARLTGYTTKLIFDRDLTRQTLAEALRNVYYPWGHSATHTRVDAQPATGFIKKSL